VSISGGSMQLMETPLINTVPGTAIPGASVAPLTRFFAAGVMTGAVLFGTLATPTVLLDGASHVLSITGTSSIPGWGGTGALRNQSAAGLLEGVRSRSQLSWGQVANTLGVSRRTVHNWLLGAAIAPGNLQRLLDFSALVGTMDRGDPGDVRIALMQPGLHGRTPLDEFALTSRPARRVPLSTLSAADLLEPIAASEVSVTTQSDRRSSLQGVPIRRSNA